VAKLVHHRLPAVSEVLKKVKMVEQILLMLGMAHQMIQSLSLLYVLIDREILNMQNFPQLQHLKILPRFSSNIIDYRLERSRSYLFSSEFVFGL